MVVWLQRGRPRTKINTHMNYISQLTTIITMIFGLTTTVGVFLHDTNVDKAFVSAWKTLHYAVRTEADDHKPGSTPHTHAEHGEFSKVLKDGKAHPRSTPRSSDRKHLHHKLASRSGDTDFDGHRLTVDPLTMTR